MLNTNKPIASMMIAVLLAYGLACGPTAEIAPRADAYVIDTTSTPRTPDVVFRQGSQVTIGLPTAVAVDFEGRAFIADASPGRILSYDPKTARSFEFQTPTNRPGFYPTDVGIHGFFLYAIDDTGRLLVRFDASGTYRDVLLDFNKLSTSRRISPMGLDVDGSGRVAVTDVENHQVLLIGNFLQVEVSFGNYGSYDGQFDRPEGVAFVGDGSIVVADTGNRRVQYFSDGGSFRRSVPAAGSPNPFVRPRRAIVDRDGRLFVADPGAGAVFIFNKAGHLIDRVYPVDVDRFEPTDVAITPAGDLFVTDAAERCLYIFKGI